MFRCFRDWSRYRVCCSLRLRQVLLSIEVQDLHMNAIRNKIIYTGRHIRRTNLFRLQKGYLQSWMGLFFRGGLIRISPLPGPGFSTWDLSRVYREIARWTKMMKGMLFMDHTDTPAGQFCASNPAWARYSSARLRTFALTVVPHQMPFVLKIFFHSANISGQEKIRRSPGSATNGWTNSLLPRR